MLDKEQILDLIHHVIILDLIHHVIADRANVDEIDELIDWLQERRKVLMIRKIQDDWEHTAPLDWRGERRMKP